MEQWNPPARVPSGHPPCGLHHVQAEQLYLRELRGMEASARVRRCQKGTVDSHLVAFGLDSRHDHISPAVDFGVPDSCR